MRVGLMAALDLRLDPLTNPFTGAAHEGARAELRGWTRFRDGREPDPLSLLFFVDGVPPATLMIGSSGWVPTLQMSAYVRGVPDTGVARPPFHRQPRGGRHGRRDLCPVGQRGPGGGPVEPAGPLALPRRTRLSRSVAGHLVTGHLAGPTRRRPPRRP